mgnify:CR=1 FL=1
MHYKTFANCPSIADVLHDVTEVVEVVGLYIFVADCYVLAMTIGLCEPYPAKDDK